MKIVKSASGKKTIKISKKEWESIGKDAGWFKKSQVDGTQSIRDKMDEATGLAFKCAYATTSPDDTYLHEKKESDFPSVTKAVWDEVWSWADGLAQEEIMKKIEGRTSLQETIDFDMGKAEAYIDKTIQLFRETLSIVGPPRKLSQEEYHSMGYKS